MELTKQELDWIYWGLIAQRAYRNTEIPYGVVLWEPWKQDFLNKVTHDRNQHETKAT